MFSEWLMVGGAVVVVVLPLAVAWLITGRRPHRMRRANAPVVRCETPTHQAPPE